MGRGAFSWDGEGLARKQTEDNPTVGYGSREQQMLLSRNSPEGDESDGPEGGAGVRGGSS